MRIAPIVLVVLAPAPEPPLLLHATFAEAPGADERCPFVILQGSGNYF